MSTAQPNEGIELLYTPDCMVWRDVLANLEAVLRELTIPDTPRLIPVDTLDQARVYNFFASPTIHIHGIDIDPKARRLSRRGLGVSRPYLYGGRTYAVPPTELIRAGLKELYNTP